MPDLYSRGRSYSTPIWCAVELIGRKKWFRGQRNLTHPYRAIWPRGLSAGSGRPCTTRAGPASSRGSKSSWKTNRHDYASFRFMTFRRDWLHRMHFSNGTWPAGGEFHLSRLAIRPQAEILKETRFSIFHERIYENAGKNGRIRGYISSASSHWYARRVHWICIATRIRVYVLYLQREGLLFINLSVFITSDLYTHARARTHSYIYNNSYRRILDTYRTEI